MPTLLFIIIFVFVIIRIILSIGRKVYFPNDDKSKIQINAVKKNLKEVWGIEPGDFWIPLDGNISHNTCYFNTDEFNINFGFKNLSSLINQLEKGKIYSFGESSIYSQFDHLELENYPGLDTYYTNSSADWVIYITHENTIAFGGRSIIDALKIRWTDSDKFINPFEQNTNDYSHQTSA